MTAYLTNQEIFDRVAAHLLTQNKKSYLTDVGIFDEKECAYRSPEGLKCGIGALITDEAYDPKMENLAIIDLFSWFPWVMKECGLHTRSGRLLKGIQNVHDYDEPHEWPQKLKELARRHRLKTMVVDQYAQ